MLRCVWCGLPIWAETLWHGRSYYRERKGTRSHGICVNEGKMVHTDVMDDQVAKIVESIKLDPSWERHMAGIINELDQRAQIESERHSLEQRLRRLGKAYVVGLLEEEEYEDPSSSSSSSILKSRPDLATLLNSAQSLHDTGREGAWEATGP